MNNKKKENYGFWGCKATKRRGREEEEQFRGVILTLCVVIDYISGRPCLT